jgi:hypothetical protein
MSTPEAKVKKMVKDVLAEFSEKVTVSHTYTGADVFVVTTLYQYWPVPAGFGASSLDCIVGYYGYAIFIETKAPGKKPTPRQNLTIAEVAGASCYWFVIDGPQGCDELRGALTRIKDNRCKQ